LVTLQNVLLQKTVYDSHRHLWRVLSQHPIVPLKSPIPGDNTDFIKYMKKNLPGVPPDLGKPAQRWSWIGNSMLPQNQALNPQTMENRMLHIRVIYNMA
jgi:hypothetical protein